MGPREVAGGQLQSGYLRHRFGQQGVLQRGGDGPLLGVQSAQFPSEHLGLSTAASDVLDRGDTGEGDDDPGAEDDPGEIAGQAARQLHPWRGHDGRRGVAERHRRLGLLTMDGEGNGRGDQVGRRGMGAEVEGVVELAER